MQSKQYFTKIKNYPHEKSTEPELLQSSAVDCIVRYRRPYSLLQWTVQSIIADCNNLPFKRTWLTLRNGLLFLWLVI